LANRHVLHSRHGKHSRAQPRAALRAHQWHSQWSLSTATG
jgi:hypothetical protein